MQGTPNHKYLCKEVLKELKEYTQGAYINWLFFLQISISITQSYVKHNKTKSNNIILCYYRV